jgi:hypothetical protein
LAPRRTSGTKVYPRRGSGSEKVARRETSGSDDEMELRAEGRQILFADLAKNFVGLFQRFHLWLPSMRASSAQ